MIQLQSYHMGACGISVTLTAQCDGLERSLYINANHPTSEEEAKRRAIDKLRNVIAVAEESIQYIEEDKQ